MSKRSGEGGTNRGGRRPGAVRPSRPGSTSPRDGGAQQRRSRPGQRPGRAPGASAAKKPAANARTAAGAARNKATGRTTSAPVRTANAKRTPRAKRPTAAQRRARVQRRRRLAAMAGVVLALVVIVALIWGVVTGGKAIFAKVKPAPNPSASPTAQATYDPENPADWQALDEQERFKALKGTEVPLCPIDAVTPSVSATQTEGSVSIAIGLRSAHPIPCLVGNDKRPVAVTLHSGDELIWTNTTCLEEQTRLLLSPGTDARVQMNWPKKRRTEGCELGADTRAGTYRMQVKVGSQTAESAFQVR